jgi:hypothetical protein
MGVEATITVLTRGERRKKQWPPDLPKFELFKDWPELDSALEELGGPATMALRGRKPVREDEEMDFGWVVVPPTLVKKISTALGKVPDAELLEVVHRQRKKIGWRLRKYEHKGVIAVFNTLKAAYHLAARKGAYLEILFC